MKLIYVTLIALIFTFFAHPSYSDHSEHPPSITTNVLTITGTCKPEYLVMNQIEAGGTDGKVKVYLISITPLDKQKQIIDMADAVVAEIFPCA